MRSGQPDKCSEPMDHEEGGHTLTCFLDDLLGLFLGLEESLDALGLASLYEIRSNRVAK